MIHPQLLPGRRSQPADRNSLPNVAAASRAIPMTPKQSTRLEVISYSKTTSCRPSASIGVLLRPLHPPGKCRCRTPALPGTYSGRAKLLDGAHHAVGLNAAQLTLFDLDAALGHSCRHDCPRPVRRPEQPGTLSPSFTFGSTGNDLNRPLLTFTWQIIELIRIRMLLDGHDLSDHDLVQDLGLAVSISLHLGTGQCHGIGILLRCHVEIRYICFNP